MTSLQVTRLVAVVVAQLVERSPPIPEVCSSNPLIGKIYIEHFTVNCIEKTKNKEKEAGNGQFFKKVISCSSPKSKQASNKNELNFLKKPIRDLPF